MTRYLLDQVAQLLCHGLKSPLQPLFQGLDALIDVGDVADLFMEDI
jgi:hypothetical protein